MIEFLILFMGIFTHNKIVFIINKYFVLHISLYGGFSDAEIILGFVSRFYYVMGYKP